MTVTEFSEWISSIIMAGVRGFRVSDIVKAHGDGYHEQLNRWIEKGWLEQRGGTDVLWISDTGKDVLKGVA